jgi:hypothetical protein
VTTEGRHDRDHFDETPRPLPGVGRVARVIGPVVDIEFPVDQMPDIYNALTVQIDLSGPGRGRGRGR